MDASYIKQLEERIEAIEKRNIKVEKDKEWETSVVRKSLIAVLTYIVVVIFFITIKIEEPFINAIVPVAGFLLSTLSFSMVKKWWIEKYSK